jgi:protein ImuB
MIVCVLLPRFELAVAIGDREGLLQGPAALAPEPGREQLVGEVSAAAEVFGIDPGMRLGEALARCPRLALIPPDPVGVADDWERVLTRLESVGAAVESNRPGIACFEARGLHRLHGGSLDGVVTAVRGALRRPARIGAGPSRFCAIAGACLLYTKPSPRDTR